MTQASHTPAQPQSAPERDLILILDFGSQVTQLIARRVREAGVYCDIVPFHVSADSLRSRAPRGIILSGGPASVAQDDAPAADRAVYDLGVPVLGICYGMQTMCATLGGAVTPSSTREYGRARLDMKKNALFEGVGDAQVWMSHGDSVTRLPQGFATIASTDGCPQAAVADDARRFYGVQFHPEVVHTRDGARLLANFVKDICGCRGDWSMASYKDEMIAAIRAQVGGERVICGVSGGVDSTVTAALLHAAIGAQATCIFVDTGLMRKDEAQEVVELFRTHFNIPLVHEAAGDLFLSRLAGVSDPEQKRKIIGKTFIDVFEAARDKAGDAAFLAQGTLYPDVIESVAVHGGPAATIKSHHNVGGLPAEMRFKLVEPLRQLFKDEVRALGRALGLPEKFIDRHPFPGPGLGIRIPGEVTADSIAILQQADAVFIEELRASGLYEQTWQAFAVLLPVRTVGVMGDGRTYDRVVALRAVTSVDGMTADYAPLPHDFLGRVAVRIVNEVRGVNRVVYDITSKPPGTIEWE